VAATIFPTVTVLLERRYVLRYWRYLLGWRTVPPSGYGLPLPRLVTLRSMVRRHVALTNKRKSKPATVIQWPTKGAA
jgi:hypothetical protein